MNKILLFLFLFCGVVQAIEAQDVDDKLNYALIEAAAEGNTELVIDLLKKQADVNFRDVNNGTALFYATQNNHFDIVKILIYNGADMNFGLDNGFTPLMSACYNGYFDIAEYLASQGAMLDVRDEYYATALDYSIAMGDYYMVDMLLFYNANPHLLTYDKTSTLLIASLIGDTAIAGLLLQKGVKTDLINDYGYSALSVAVQNNDSLMFDFLMAHGADPKVLEIKKYKPYAWALLNENIYAYHKLKPERFSLQSMKNNRYNSLNIAYGMGDLDLVRELKNEGVSSGWLPYYNAATFHIATSFNSSDAFFNVGLGLQDAKYKTDIQLTYGTRWKQKAIVFERADNSYLQLWEHRRYIELALRKRFEWKMEYFTVGLYAGFGAQFMFGLYDGVRQKIYPKFALVPQIGAQIDMDGVYFLLGYEYTPYQLYTISNHKFKIGLAYRLNFVRKPAKYKLLWI